MRSGPVVDGYEQWTKLIDYYVACLERDDLFRQPLPKTGHGRRFIVNPVGREELVVGLSGSILLPRDAPVERFLEAQDEKGRQLYWGYPCVFALEEEAEGQAPQPVLYPVFALEVRAIRDPGGIRLVADEETPSLCAAAFRFLGLKQEHMSELAREVERRRAELADEDPVAVFQELFEWIEEKTGAPVCEPIDPDDLGHWRPGRLREPGVYNLAVLFAGERSTYYQGLLDELRALRGLDAFRALPETALGAFLRLGERRGEAMEWIATVVPANEAQLEAATQAFGGALTVVTGPPGTGKSQLIVNLLATAAAQGRSVLFASKNNQAVDVVCQKLRELEPDAILRTGSREYRAGSLEQLRKGLLSFGKTEWETRWNSTNPHLFASSSPAAGTGGLSPYQEACQRSWASLRSALAAVDRRVRWEVAVKEAWEGAENAERVLAPHARPLVHRKDLNPRYLRRLGFALQRCASALQSPPRSLLGRCLIRPVYSWYGRVLTWRVRQLAKKMPDVFDAGRAVLEKPSAPELQAIGGTLGAIAEARQAREHFERVLAQGGTLPSYEELEKRLEEAFAEHLQRSRGLLAAARREARLRAAGSSELRRYVAVAERRQPWWLDSLLSREVVATFPHVLRFFPVWATTNLSTARSFPLVTALFDLLVVDEASQCDIASALPLLYRAKTAVIIGDPKQLIHVCNVPGELDSALAKRTGAADLPWLPVMRFSDRSLYHAAEALADKPPILLDQHFRCHPQIAELSNRLFYSQALTVLTDPARLLAHVAEDGQAVRWVHVKGKTTRPPTGSAFNEPEARAVAEEVVRLHRELGSADATMGVVTPFSRQAELVERLLQARLDKTEWERRRLVVATAHRFQGDERDVVVFSPVVAQGAPLPTVRWLANTPNLLNVAITRARSLLLVVGDREFCLKTEGLLSQVAEYVRELEKRRKIHKADAQGLLHSPIERRLYEALLERGLDVRPKAVIGPYEVDFLVQGKSRRPLIVECDGATFHGSGRRRRIDMVRDSRLRAMGYQVLRLPGWQILADPAGCVDDVLHRLDASRSTRAVGKDVPAVSRR